MKYISLELNDPFAKECGRCANCLGEGFFKAAVCREKALKAIEYLRGDFLTIEARK